VTFDPLGFGRRSKEKTRARLVPALREAFGQDVDLRLIAEGWRLPPAWVGGFTLGVAYAVFQRRYFLGLTAQRLLALRVTYPKGRIKGSRFDLPRETLELVSFGEGATKVTERGTILRVRSTTDDLELRFLFHPPWFYEAQAIANEIRRTQASKE
jgi:hypothetical protein